MSAVKIASVALISALGLGAFAAPASATVSCDAPTMINGSFEDYPIDSSPITNNENFSAIGAWMNDWGTPDQFLFLDQNDADQILPGWETTNSENLLELQRQVAGFEQSGTNDTLPYFDETAVQPADGDVWAELNATEDAALYQDLVLTGGVEYTWSIKHHGRVFEIDATDEMGVEIGPADGSLVQQTDLLRFAPTNANLFVGEPTYGTTGEATDTIAGTMEDGWVKYQGTFTPSTDATYRFSFYAISGWDLPVGNMIDDVQFEPTACLATDTLPNTGANNTMLFGFGAIAAVAAAAGSLATRRGARAARR